MMRKLLNKGLEVRLLPQLDKIDEKVAVELQEH
jgi:hypothetical protein